MNPLKKDLDKVDPGLLSQAKELIKGVRESLKELSSGPFAITEAEFKTQIEQSLPYVTGLIDLTLAFKDEFAKAKQELGMLDFSDLEHLCLASCGTNRTMAVGRRPKWPLSFKTPSKKLWWMNIRIRMAYKKLS